MNRFSYVRPESLPDAVLRAQRVHSAQFIAGGTNLVDLIKENVARPSALIDLNRLPLRTIELTSAQGLKIGALVSNSDVAYDEQIRTRYPLLSEAILAGASAQVRNMATVGGNLLQRTRCSYFYDTATACNKREPGTGCGALNGVNRMHAILGASDECIAVHPSDMCVALAALDAIVHVRGTYGDRALPMSIFHRLPGSTPHIDTELEHDEIITAVELPEHGFAKHHAYIKVRDRTSFAFALVSVALGIELDVDTVIDVRCALGGVAHKPWRNHDLENQLKGQPLTTQKVRKFAGAMMADARGRRGNAFKIELATRVIVRAFEEATQRTFEG
ncbi:aldehyde dehydrogenase, FAD-binding subunit [Pararobbsia alpina]|uniref:FAD binding domain-containing protein n=1 Tax=Pararobbsia alpina TaxID=621374 RepID=UPI0039A506D1